MIGGAERHRPRLNKVQPVHRQMFPFWPMKSIANGVPHIRRAHMRHQRPILEPHQRVDQAFWMHHNLDFVGRYAEKLFGFNDL